MAKRFKQFKAPMFGLPLKTFWTCVWLVLIGAVALLYHFETRPDSLRASASSSYPATTGPLGAVPPVGAGYEDAEEADDDDAPLSAEALRASLKAPKPPRQAIEDPARSMCSFYAALKKLSAEKKGDAKVRVLHFGDSILTTDQLSGTIRRKLQTRFGDGGHGFVLLGQPWRWYHHLDVRHGANGKWRIRPSTSAPTRDGLMGLGGVAFESGLPNAAAWAGTADEGTFGRTVSTYDISYLMQPKGGMMDIYIDDVLKESLSTLSEAKQSAHHKVEVAPGPSKLTIRTRGDGPVRVFGAILENEKPGVVYDSLAINGARISTFDRLNEDHFKEELQHRRADLVVMMCGANEGNNDALALSAYKAQLSSVLHRIREALPDAGCLVMGPLDQATYGNGGALVSKKMPKKLTRAQREIAGSLGCAFFDTFSAMGGDGSMPKWVRRGLVGGDFIHPTETGARMIGKWLTEAMLAGYDNFVLNGESCELNATSL